MNALTPIAPNGGGLVPQNMNDAMRLAEMMARGKLVPSHLQSSPGDCLMVIEQATRWGMSPFAVAQSTSVIQGKLMFEGKLVAAALHTSGALATRLRYDYSGEGDARQITVSATLAGEPEPRSVVVRLKDAKTSNRMWQVQSDQQLAYHGARVWARRYAPEVMLGVYSPEEMEQPRREPPHAGPTIEARAEPASDIPALDEPPPPKRTKREVLRDKLVGCFSRDEVAALNEGDWWRDLIAGLKPEQVQTLQAMVDEKFRALPEPSASDLPEQDPAEMLT